jgi:predicted amidohydrolase
MHGTNALAVCQFEPEIGDPEANVATMCDLLADLDDAVQVAVFPELCVTGYDLDLAGDLAMTPDDARLDPLVEAAAWHDVHLVVGLPEAGEDGIYNSLVYLTDRGVETVYRKRYPWGDESDVFETGTEATTVETPLGKAGFLLCYDINFPEATLPYAHAACDLVFASAAWRKSYHDDWDLLLRARARDTTCYVAGSNHAGDQNGRVHAGNSLIATPQGTIAATLGNRDEGTSVPVEKAVLDTARERNPVNETRRQRGE